MKTLFRLSVLLLLSAISDFSIGQDTPPPPGTPKDFTVPEVKTFTLGNGLKVTLVPFGNLPKTTISLVVRSGNLNEAENEIWLADFTGNLMKEGTSTRSALQISNEVAAMGGTLTISTGVETTFISSDVLSEFAQQMAGLIADVAINPVFPESEAERLKNDMIRDLNIQKSQPANIAYELFSKVLYPGHPYGRLFPDEKMIRSFNVERALEFYTENFGALRSHVFVAGLFDEQKVEKAIRDSFSRWVEGSEPLVNIPPKPQSGMIHFVERAGAPQSVLNIGMPVPDPSEDEYIPLVLTNSLLGGSFTSRITRNIREDKGYTYSPYSRLISRYRSALWMQFAEVSTDVTLPSLKEIMAEVKRLTEEPVSNSELKGIKNYLSGIFVMSNSTNAGIISQLAFLDLHGLGIEWLNNYINNIHKVTSEDVQTIMKKFFDPSVMTIVVAGDREKIGSGIAEFGKVAEAR